MADTPSNNTLYIERAKSLKIKYKFHSIKVIISNKRWAYGTSAPEWYLSWIQVPELKFTLNECVGSDRISFMIQHEHQFNFQLIKILVVNMIFTHFKLY